MTEAANNGRGSTYKSHVAESKKDTVKYFVDMLDKYDVIAAVNMENLPARQLQVMKETLRDKVVIKMTKRRLLDIAIKQSKKKDIQEITKHLKGMPALLFSKDDPFTLYNTIKKSKSKAPIKGGQTTPNDIIVPAGKTNFSPGPIIGELGAFRIKSGIEDGKVAIKSDCLVAKEGDVVNTKLAAILTRLGIQPMEVGLDITAVYENGNILQKDVLNIDEEEYMNNLIKAHVDSLALAIEIGYITPETAELLISKAEKEALTLATEANILTDATVGNILAKAESHASELKKHTG
ncbi:MAG: 50S ribosomal protein L10 [Nanoarchaeota archaeon]|nr:50S ribosomal protein L10 [Nanoarchaeota archaeon]